MTFQGSFKRHEFRCRRGLNLHQEIESFADEFFDREKMKSLGWVEAESIDGTGCKTFEELREKVTLTPQAALLTPSGWPKVPVQITNQELISLADPSFLEDAARVKDVKSFGNLKKEISASERSHGWTIPFRNFVQFRLPSNLLETKVDSLLATDCWWTEAHVETNGDDSISFTPLGRKLFLICHRGLPSTDLHSIMRSPRYFMKFVKSGPANNADRSGIRFFIPGSRHMFRFYNFVTFSLYMPTLIVF